MSLKIIIPFVPDFLLNAVYPHTQNRFAGSHFLTQFFVGETLSIDSVQQIDIFRGNDLFKFRPQRQMFLRCRVLELLAGH